MNEPLRKNIFTIVKEQPEAFMPAVQAYFE